MRKLVSFSVFIFIFCHSLFAGVHIFSNFFDSINPEIEKAQEGVAQIVKKLNQKAGNAEKFYYFDNIKPKNSHVTLAYITDDQDKIDQIKPKFEQIKEALTQVAQSCGPIDLTENFKKAELDFWRGNHSEHGGKKKPHYYYVVAKLKAPAQLNRLVIDLDEKLKTLITFYKRTHSFTPHITLGQIYQDSDNLAGFERELKEFVGKRVFADDLQVKHELKISALKLKWPGISGNYVCFNLSQEQSGWMQRILNVIADFFANAWARIKGIWA